CAISAAPCWNGPKPSRSCRFGPRSMPKAAAKPAAEPSKTPREAGPLVLPVVRVEMRNHVNRQGELVVSGTVEIRRDLSRASPFFLCGGKIRHLKRGCGQNCPCIACAAAPRRDGKPPAQTPSTCGCIKCRRRRRREVEG